MGSLNLGSLFTALFGALLALSFSHNAAAEDDASSALVQLIIEQNGSFLECRGVAVSTHIILTAAHCVAGKNPASIYVNTHFGRMKARDIQTHPLYSTVSRIPHFDIALLSTEKAVTDAPLPIMTSLRLSAGDRFLIFQSAEPSTLSHGEVEPPHPMFVADVNNMILDYINLKRGTFAREKDTQEIETRLKDRDPNMLAKVEKEFGGFMFSLYTKSKSSICMGDSGSPAVVSKNGRLGVIGLATAVTNFEAVTNPQCTGGGTSIFTSLNQAETIQFVRNFSSEIQFE